MRALPSWSNNAVKRLVKAPKPHFVDTGLAVHPAYFTAEKLNPEKGPFAGPRKLCPRRTRQAEPLERGPLQLLAFPRQGRGGVDIVVENHEGRIAGVEVKAAATVGRRDFAGLTWQRQRVTALLAA